MKKLISIFLLVILVAVWQMREWAVQSGPLSSLVSVIVSRGASSTSVALALRDAGVIDKPWLFMLIGRMKGLDKKIRAGEYQFEPHTSLFEALLKLTSGEVFYRKITFAEGMTTAQFVKILQTEPMLGGDITIEVKEGELLPETYSFTYGDSRDSIILRAKKAMQKLLAEQWEERVENLPLKSAEEMLILASIIEKETGVPEERRQVASVFVNRLRKGMKLQTDPTVIYALTQGKTDLERALTRTDLAVDNRYNTYKYFGLPPGPICNPGAEAIKAAANPDASEYLYFVASGNGGHNFAKSLNEHNQNVRIWRNKK